MPMATPPVPGFDGSRPPDRQLARRVEDTGGRRGVHRRVSARRAVFAPASSSKRVITGPELSAVEFQVDPIRGRGTALQEVDERRCQRPSSPGPPERLRRFAQGPGIRGRHGPFGSLARFRCTSRSASVQVGLEGFTHQLRESLGPPVAASSSSLTRCSGFISIVVRVSDPPHAGHAVHA
jgi:hypothetical protein